MLHDSRASQTKKSPDGERLILLAEDDPEMRRLVADALRKLGHRVIEASVATELLRQVAQPANEHSPDKPEVDLIVSDVRMPGGNGLDIIEILRSAGSRIPVIVMTAFGDWQTRARADRLGAILLDKPFRVERLVHAVRTLLA